MRPPPPSAATTSAGTTTQVPRRLPLRASASSASKRSIGPILTSAVAVPGSHPLPIWGASPPPKGGIAPPIGRPSVVVGGLEGAAHVERHGPLGLRAVVLPGPRFGQWIAA